MKQEYDFSAGGRSRFYRENANFNLPASEAKPDWVGSTGQIGKHVEKESEGTLAAYREQPYLVTEHANLERNTAQGGYAHRQLFELVQNSADALISAPSGKSILVRLTKDFLYCADDGNPIDKDGIKGLMFAHMSSKWNTMAIGRFGLGFKSVLGVSDAPEFYSRPGSFRFDRRVAAERIAKVACAEHYPVLRLPEPIDPDREKNEDEELRELMSWATNIVRLPLIAEAHGDLARQIREFPPEFLLFVDHVRYLTLEDGERTRELVLRAQDGEFYLDTGEGVARWRCFKTLHHLSERARSDRRPSDDGDEVPIWWAAPLARLTDPGKFWAFFPTHTASLVAGILNAPWKTNEDRQNLLPGPYNDELVEAAAEMIARELPELATNDDPARHLDALPRRHEAGDPEQACRLRERLFSCLHEREVVPDQDGSLRARCELSFPPKELTPSGQMVAAPFERWEAYPDRPSNWLHHKALSRNRLAAIDRLFHPGDEPPKWPSSGAPRATIAKWLEALVKAGETCGDTIDASKAAVQVAALIPNGIRESDDLGAIVLTATGALRTPDPERLFLPEDPLNGGNIADPALCVHPDLVSDRDTLSALKKLKLKPPSPESSFRTVVKRVLHSGSSQGTNDALHIRFWVLSRKLMAEGALAIIREFRDQNRRELWPTALRVRTLAGNWQPLHAVLRPGDIVPGDGSRDDDATVDTHFHEPDDELLRALGTTAVPQDGRDLSMELQFKSYRNFYRDKYRKQDNLPHIPYPYYLDFKRSKGAGPLGVFTSLSDEGRSLYTDALLNLDTCYEQWTMQHTGSNRRTYPTMPCESLTIHMLREHGRIRTSDGIVPLSDALGPFPKSPDAVHVLLTHHMVDKLKAAFDLAEPTPEFFGEEDPIPLVDVWPGLKGHLPPDRKTCRLIRCERILVIGELRKCIFHISDVYLADTVEEEQRIQKIQENYRKEESAASLGRMETEKVENEIKWKTEIDELFGDISFVDDEQGRLRLVADELELGLSRQQLEAILQRKTPREIEKRRAAIRECSTDAARLLAAVGEQALRRDLPDSLLAVIESDGATLTGCDLAEAAIATWHTDSLKQYKRALDRLDPPSKWAGSARAVQFVRSLGFSAEWAGERDRQRAPFLEVEGPYSLPELHGYQRAIAENVRKLLRGEHGNSTERRGMISLPTGSGKTRVAVQAIVEAMGDDGFRGGVLWVADRDELCEQAVEAWRQVWSSKGSQASRLRISRMWGGQPRPLPTNELHVVVATIQTLNAKLSNQLGDYGFLVDFKLVVFDEAHRSIAPTFTSVMQDIGLTCFPRFQRADEPFLLGLTATPYRGHDEEETARLVGRYGRKRLDSGAFLSDDPQAVVRELQGMGVLAQANHKIIEGETFSAETVSPEEWERILEELKQALSLPWLPQSVENRIARSSERTRRIIEAYETHVQPDWPTLIFATSVEHAQTVAALLNRRGIRSRAVSGTTEPATRRRVVEEFRCGKLRALVNYGVFREGFDAPKTRAIIVARPVYSPNLYFQMIGRGLRGPMNGGEERCLILNVRDNIQSFDRALAFSELDWLWA